MNCPQCGGEMWDNNKSKFPKKPNGPDFRCKNKECVDEKGFTTAVWLEKKPFQGFQGTPPNAPIPPVMKPVDNGGCKDVKSDMMRLAYRTDLMVALIDKLSETVGNEEIKIMFDYYWSEIEK